MVDVLGVLRQATRQVRYRIKSKALILLYHRIIQLPADPYLLTVTPQHFAEHLEIVRKLGRPMTLHELAQNLRDGHVPDRAIIITFDDGYRDNLYNAKPLLEKHDIPATVFVTTWHMENARKFWWDELSQLLLSQGILPQVLRLNVDGRACEYELGEAANYSADDYARHRDWHIERTDDPSARHRVFRSLYQSIQPLPQMQQTQVLDELCAQASIKPMNRAFDGACSREEVARLSEGRLIEIGAHTVAHSLLAGLAASAQRDEICRSKSDLEDVLNRPVTSFAYPHGSYSDQTRAIIREAGFACACSSNTDVVWQSADSFQLPRVGVRDGDGDTFARWLKAWLGN